MLSVTLALSGSDTSASLPLASLPSSVQQARVATYAIISKIRMIFINFTCFIRTTSLTYGTNCKGRTVALKFYGARYGFIPNERFLRCNVLESGEFIRIFFDE